MKSLAAFLSVFVLALSGCGIGSVAGGANGSGGAVTGALTIQGTVHGGQQPVANTTLQLWTVGTTGYGSAPTQVATTMTNSSGAFVLPGYTCASSTELLYLTATGGSPGAGNPVNNQILLMAALGPCNQVNPALLGMTINVNVNEVTTVASVYALAQFMDPSTGNIGYPSASPVGITNAFATVNNLVNISTGAANQYTPNGNGWVPLTEINTLANLLAACVNSTGGLEPQNNACGNLFVATMSNVVPTNTLLAILGVALHPANSGLYGMVTTTGPFQPTLTSNPHDWVMPVLYSGSGPGTEDLAIDASGNIWTANIGSNGNFGGVSELSNLGVPFAGSPYLSGNSGIDSIAVDLGGNAWVVNGSTAEIFEVTPGGASTAGPLSFQETSTPLSIAVDGGNDIWIPNASSNSVTELNNAGPISTLISPSGGYTGGNLNNPWDVAIDAGGNAWVTNWNGNSLTKITPAGSLSNTLGSNLNAPEGLAIDRSGDLWVDNSNGNLVDEFNNSGVQTFTTGGDATASSLGSYLSVDGLNDVWSANENGGSLAEYNGTGTLSPAGGYQGPPATIAATSYTGRNLNTAFVARVDQSGNVWVGDFSGIPIALSTNSYLTEFVGLAGPTIQPLAGATQQGLTGQLPGTSPGTTLTVTTSGLPAGAQTEKYNFQLLAQGGTGNGYTWQVTSGQSSLTSVGLTLSTGGTLSGTLSGTESNAVLHVKVTDSAGNTATKIFSLTVNALTSLSITTTNLPSATVGTNYNQQFAASGGSGSYSWTIPNTSQQTALSNDSINFSLSGGLNGTPTSANTGISFTVQVTDLATGQTASAPYTLVVNAPVLQQCTHDGSGNSLLNGHYAFLLTGFDSAGNVLDQIGSFQADAAGHITNGMGDQNNSGYATQGEQSYTFSGTYSIGSTDGRGQMVLNVSNNTNPQYFCFVTDPTSSIAGSGRVIEATGDGTIQTGVFQVQSTGNFVPAGMSGGYVFGVQGENAGPPLQRGGLVGQLTLNGSGGVSSGQVDIATYKNSSSSTSYTSAATLSAGGTYTMGSGGRGTLNISAGGGGGSFIIYQFGLGSGFFMLSSPNINTNTLLAGYAQQQNLANFSTANVAAKGVFREDGVDNPSSNSVDSAQIGQLGFDGLGNLSYIADNNDGGNVTAPSSVAAANYSVTSLGYLTITNAGNHSPNFYLYAPGSGFGLDSSSEVGLWVMSRQTGAGSFTTSSVSGGYAFGTVNPLAYSSSGAGTSSGNPFPDVFDATGTFTTSTVSLVQDEDQAPGTIPWVTPDETDSQSWTLDPTYGASTGRFTIGGEVTGYIVSPTQVFLLGTHSGHNPQVIIGDHQ